MEIQTRTPLRTARTAMVASANPQASLIGIEILRAGGNAADATVAMGAALAVMEPHNSQVGGDAFAQIWDAPARKLSALNGSGPAPAGATLAAMGSEVPERGIRAAAVPGAVDAWLTLLSTWGTMTASEVLAPAIALAEDGYALPAWQAALLGAHDFLWREFPQSGAALVPDILHPGAVLYQPDLAQTLRRIAVGGRAAFYEGEFADRLLAYSNENSGFFTRADLTDCRTLILDPIQTTYRGVTVTENPPVSQGCLLLQMLNICGRLRSRRAGPGRPGCRASDGRSQKAGVCRPPGLPRRDRAAAAPNPAVQSLRRRAAQAPSASSRRAALFSRDVCRLSMAARTRHRSASWTLAAARFRGSKASSTATAPAWSFPEPACC